MGSYNLKKENKAMAGRAQVLPRGHAVPCQSEPWICTMVHDQSSPVH